MVRNHLIALENCERRLDEHVRVLLALSLSEEDSTLADFYRLLQGSLTALLRHILDIVSTSGCYDKEDMQPVAFLANTGGRPS